MGSPSDETFRKNLKVGESAKLLSLDGGGVKGISSLVILEAIMEAVKEKEQKGGINSSDTERLPRDYFHLAAGTSTGGLIALMLFRLGMSASQARTAYEQLASEVFQPTIWDMPVHSLGGPGGIGSWFGSLVLKAKVALGKDQFSDQPLKDAINHIVTTYGRPEDKSASGDAVLVNEKSARMFMCATLTDRGESVLLRSYQAPDDAKPVTKEAKQASTDGQFNTMSISVAARATSAAPTYLPEVKYEDLRFWDGGLLNNNPINQLWHARFDLVDMHTDPAPHVSCVLSLGCSWSTAKSQSIFRLQNTVTTAASFMTNTESKHVDFMRFINRIDGRQGYGDIQYFRFNTPTQDETFNLDDYQKMDELKEITLRWLKDPDVEGQILSCAESLIAA